MTPRSKHVNQRAHALIATTSQNCEFSEIRVPHRDCPLGLCFYVQRASLDIFKLNMVWFILLKRWLLVDGKGFLGKWFVACWKRYQDASSRLEATLSSWTSPGFTTI